MCQCLGEGHIHLSNKVIEYKSCQDRQGVWSFDLREVEHLGCNIKFGAKSCFGKLSGHIQDRERTQHLGTCRAPTYLQGVTQGEWVPAECLSRSVIIMYKSKYIHGGLYLSRSEKKAAFSSYSYIDGTPWCRDQV